MLFRSPLPPNKAFRMNSSIKICSGTAMHTALRLFYVPKDEFISKSIPLLNRRPSCFPLRAIYGLRSSMGYAGAKDILTFQENAEFVEITSAGVRESHVHDVIVTQEAPNYRVN